MPEAPKRPPFVKPVHWQNPPVPEPKPTVAGPPGDGSKHGLEPTRYGDWELKGIAIDF